MWVDNTAVGMTAVSTPQAEMIGKATVREHLPMQEMSWMVTIRFNAGSLLLSPYRIG